MHKESVVGVRELRQNLSKYLVRVQRGETLEVTDHGRPVAQLAPLPAATSILDRLVAEGRVTRATRSMADIPLPRGPITTEGSDALREQREERL